MKRVFLIMAMTMFFNGMVKASPESNALEPVVYYYSTVAFVETPLTYLKGSIPLSKEEALQRNHYRFSYDELHRLTSISFYNGNTPRDPNHTANHFILAHRMVFTYESDKEMITFYSTKGKQIDVMGNCREFVYQLDDNGFRKSLHFANGEGEKVENAWGIYRYQWTYLDHGGVIEDRFDKVGKPASIRPGFKFFRLRLYFNSLGHIALMQNIDKDGNLTENGSGASQDRITLNAEGNFYQWEVLDNDSELEKGNGPNVAIGILEINKYGYEVRMEQRDENNKPIYNHYGICRSRTIYDRFGNIVERRFYDEEDNPSNHKFAGYHKLKIKWDTTGNRRDSLSYYDVDDKPTEHHTRGYQKVEYAYNDKNLLEKISYLDVHGNLVNRKDTGAAYMVYGYDDNGQRSAVTLFDSTGKIIR
ncbi:MAG: hypothetical protein CBB72_012475 [Muricauda sp. TMED12]|nr:MAG: hypothetical protein CBB72_012475 [Muricauda sp. TMED12]